jgi:hypothetical protein
MNELSLRKAESSDAEQIAALVNAAFSVERFFIEGDPHESCAVSALLQTGDFLLAEEDGSLIALCLRRAARRERLLRLTLG